MSEIAKKIERAIDLLPPIPVVMIELLRALNDENAEVKEMAKIISKDPLMSMNVLKIANSALYSLPNKIATVDHAVNMLGVKEIMGICIACGAYSSLKPSGRTETFDLNEFWRHSVSTGVVARRLCQELETLDQRVIYFIGLLHDVGKVVLDRCDHENYRNAIQATQKDEITIREAEQRFIGESHDTVGGWLMDRWRLPLVFVDVAKYHHEVAESPSENRVAVALVSLADRVAWIHYLGFGAEVDSNSLLSMDASGVLQETIPGFQNIDLLQFMNDLENADEEITDMHGLLYG
jgi:putative nucleotidyltransferase with HDIG domain